MSDHLSKGEKREKREGVCSHTRSYKRVSVAVFQDVSLCRFALVTGDQIKTRWIAAEVKATLYQAGLARWRAVMEDI